MVLPEGNAVALFDFAGRIVLATKVSEQAADPSVRSRGGLKVTHRRIRFNHSRVTDSRLLRSSAGAACQSGSSKFSAISIMW